MRQALHHDRSGGPIWPIFPVTPILLILPILLLGPLLLLGPISPLAALAADPAATAPDEAPSDTVYRCEGRVPMFTNRTGYGCPEYTPPDTLSIAGNHRLFPDRREELERNTMLTPAREETMTFTPAVCALYDEWLALNQQTVGGFTAQTTQQVARWYELARIFSAISAPRYACSR